MNAVSNEKRPTSMAFHIRPSRTQISHGFKVHNLITGESKVQVVVSLGRHWVLFALGRHWVLTNGTWHVLLQSGNLFELGGITKLFIATCFCCFINMQIKKFCIRVWNRFKHGFLSRPCFQLVFHWLSKLIHLTRIRCSGWVRAAWIINEFEKFSCRNQDTPFLSPAHQLV